MKFKSFVAFALLVCVSGCLAGCKSTPESHAQTLESLRAGGFQGAIKVTSGGAPFSAGAKNVFWIGPETAVIEAEGQVDFQRPVQ